LSLPRAWQWRRDDLAGHVQPKRIPGINEINWLVVSTHLKNMSQIGNLPQIGVKMKDI